MYSTFCYQSDEGCTCSNITLKELGRLQGVFGATIDRIACRIEVSHTDEVRSEDLVAALNALGYILDENK